MESEPKPNGDVNGLAQFGDSLTKAGARKTFLQFLYLNDNSGAWWSIPNLNQGAESTNVRWRRSIEAARHGRVLRQRDQARRLKEQLAME